MYKKNSIYFIYFFILTSRKTIKSENYECEFGDRIFNGREANLGQFPWVVSLLDRNYRHDCGGGIITSKHILTAGHCFIGNFHPKFILAGDIKTKRTREEEKVQSRQLLTIDSYVVHPTYASDLQRADCDLAIVQARSEFILSENVKIGVVAPGLPTKSQNCQFAGWGSIVANGSEPSPNLLFEDIQIKNIAFKPENLVIYAKSRYQKTCSGDHGGALFCYFGKKSKQFGTLILTASEDSEFASTASLYYWIAEVLRANNSALLADTLNIACTDKGSCYMASILLLIITTNFISFDVITLINQFY